MCARAKTRSHYKIKQSATKLTVESNRGEFLIETWWKCFATAQATIQNVIGTWLLLWAHVRGVILLHLSRVQPFVFVSLCNKRRCLRSRVKWSTQTSSQLCFVKTFSLKATEKKIIETIFGILHAEDREEKKRFATDLMSHQHMCAGYGNVLHVSAPIGHKKSHE